MEAERAARLDPGDVTWFGLASLYERTGLLREALLVYRGALRSSPHPSEALRANLARAEGVFSAPTITGSGSASDSASVDEMINGGGGGGGGEAGQGGGSEGSSDNDNDNARPKNE